MASVVRRTVTGASIGVGVALLLAAEHAVPGGWVLFVVGAALLFGCAVEAAQMGARMGAPAGAALAVAGAGTLALVFPREWFDASAAVRLLAAYGVSAAAAVALARARPAAVFLAVWLAPPFAALMLLTREHGLAALIWLLVLSKVGDVAGYFGGKSFGRTHPFPRLSPGKTTEGCLASLLAGLAVGAAAGAAGWLPGGASLVGGLVAGGVLNVAAQAGDLVESAVKRRAGVKDSGPWMGASGGLLDVVDSVLLTAPVAWAAAWLLL
ncbi:MAG: phosphatidate cytidylyltransferase [Planctomycetota bacterium]